MIGWWENTDPSIASDLIRDFCAIFDAIAYYFTRRNL